MSDIDIINQALIDAVERGDELNIIEALDAGADPNIKNEDGKPLLMLAILSIHSRFKISIFEMLLEHGADVNIQYMGIPPLFLVCVEYPPSHTKNMLVELLLKAGADPNTDIRGEPFLIELMIRLSWWSNVDADSVKLLLENGAIASIDRRDSRFGNTALMFASTFGNLPIVKLLLKKGANPDIQNYYGETALTYARSTNRDVREEMISLLEGRRPSTCKKYMDAVSENCTIMFGGKRSAQNRRSKKKSVRRSSKKSKRSKKSSASKRTKKSVTRRGKKSVRSSKK